MGYPGSWPGAARMAATRRRAHQDTPEQRFRDAVRHAESTRYVPVRIEVEGARWFVARVASGQERRVAWDLCEMGFRGYAPLEREKVYRARVRGVNGRVPKIRVRPVFTGYVFVGAPRGTGLVVRSLHERILDVLGGPDGPIEIPAALIGAINAREFAGKWDHVKRAAPFKPGDLVRIVDGAFAGFPGVIAALPADIRIKVEASIFGRLTPVVMEACQVERV
jgi:transcription termination/antitermination protein NusG